MFSKLIVTVGSIFLIAIGITIFGQSPEMGEFTLQGPFVHKNLQVFLIQSDRAVTKEDLITLSDALNAEKLVVHEKGNVQELEVESKSDEPIFIQAGCIVKGGRQDRILRYDMVVAPKSGKQPIESFCVEHGRWSKRGSESDDKFEASPGIVANNKIKSAAVVARSQAEVWSQVDEFRKDVEYNIRGGTALETASITSLPLAMADSAVQKNTSEYVESINKLCANNSDAIGIVVAINGAISCADFYRSPALFKKMQPALLEAAAMEAASTYSDSSSFDNFDKMKVSEWLTQSFGGEKDSTAINKDMTLNLFKTDASVAFESYYNSGNQEWIHTNILAR